jgi:NTE family protein
MRAGSTAFVLGGGGVLGATQVGMLAALLERELTPELVVGASVGALNGALVAADPTPGCVERLTELWTSLAGEGVFSSSLWSQAARMTKHGTHLHSPEPLRRLLRSQAGRERIEQLPVPFQCVAAGIETASAKWFDSGPLVDAVVASCSVPGLFPPAAIDGQHYFDGGLVHSIPIGRALTLGARRIFVLHVGRIEQPLRPPRWPWQVGLVAFEIARRHRFVEEMSQLPADVEVHVLPSGMDANPSLNLRYRDASRVPARIAAAHRASAAYLDALT